MRRPHWSDNSEAACMFRRRELLEALKGYTPPQRPEPRVYHKKPGVRRKELAARRERLLDQLAAVEAQLATKTPTQLRREEIIAEVEFLGHARTFEQIAGGMGMTVETLRRYLFRWGRGDLVPSRKEIGL